MQKKFKDKEPTATIEYAKKIIKELGVEIKIVENNSKVGVYSVVVDGYFNGVLINSSNGKGTSPEYALASGLAEFLERTQNIVCVYDCLFEYVGDFKFYPDEINLTVEKLFEKYSNILNEINVLNSIKNEKNEILCIPFVNLITKQKVFFPVYKIDSSNGFCAGNSKEEAIVQGTSELVERYSQSIVLEKQLNPPIIPDEVLKQYPDLYKIICNMRKDSRYRLLLKDCTIIEGFPVVASILIDKETHTYAVNFGSFPSFRIALERCLTELLQNHDLETVKKRYISIGKNFDDKTFCKLNSLDAIKDGVAYYPLKFFNENDFDFELSNRIDLDDKSNIEIYNRVIEVLKLNGIDLYARNNSFLGFDSWQLKSPQLMIVSEKSQFADYAEEGIKIVRMMVKKDLAKLSNLEIAELRLCIKKITNINIIVNRRLSEVLKKAPLLEDLQLFTIYGTIALKAKLYEEAYYWYGCYFKYGAESSTLEHKILIGLYDYLGLTLSSKNKNEIITTMKTFYTSDLVNIISKIINEELNVFEVLYKKDENTYNRFFNKEEIFNTFMYYEILKNKMLESEIYNG